MQVKLKHTDADPVRLSFNDLFVAKSYKNSPLNYAAKFIIVEGGANHKAIMAAIQEVAVEKFGKKADSKIEQHKTNNMKFCYIKSDEDDIYDGAWILSSKRNAEKKGRPTVIDGKKRTILPPGQEPTEQQEKDQNFVRFDGKPYSGCYVNAVVDIYAQTGEFEGIRCSLGGVQYAKDGDAFSGGAAAKKDDFDEVDDGADATDSFE